MLEERVDRRSGLLGISGVGSDMRRLQEAASANAGARLAIQMLRKQVAAMIVEWFRRRSSRFTHTP